MPLPTEPIRIIRGGSPTPGPARHAHVYRRYAGRVLCDTPGCRAELLVPDGADLLRGGPVIHEGGLPGSLWCEHGVLCAPVAKDPCEPKKLDRDYTQHCPLCARGATLKPTLSDDIEDLGLAFDGLWIAIKQTFWSLTENCTGRVERFLVAHLHR